jgi:hypothetical protein
MTGRFRLENTENRWNMEAVFWLEFAGLFPMIFGRNTASSSSDFRWFSASFLQDPAAGIFDLGINQGIFESHNFMLHIDTKGNR